MPLVTVLMPVKNGGQFIAESVMSIREQSHKDFELLVINDQSTDDTLEIISRMGMKRLRVIGTKGPGGLVNALNFGVSQSDSQYIARLDADDLAKPHRLAMQLKAFESNPQLGLCGSWAKTFGNSSLMLKFPEQSAAINTRMLFSNPFAHSAVMFQRQAPLDPEFPYNSQFEVAEDYKLWTEIALRWEVQNLPEVLMNYRVHSNQISRIKTDLRIHSVSKIHRELFETIGIDFSEEEMKLHTRISTEPFLAGMNPKLIPQILRWFSKIQREIIQSGYSTSAEITQELYFQKIQLLKFGLMAPAKSVLDITRVRK